MSSPRKMFLKDSSTLEVLDQFLDVFFGSAGFSEPSSPFEVIPEFNGGMFSLAEWREVCSLVVDSILPFLLLN